MMANSSSSLSIQSRSDVAVLRSRLKQLDVWPAGGDEFLRLLAKTRMQPDRFTSADYEWITLVARDALLSCDIGARYPAFFQKLLRCPDLLQAFLIELDQQQYYWQNADDEASNVKHEKSV